MASAVFVQKYNDFPYNEREILRYAGCASLDEDNRLLELMRECIKEVETKKVFTFSVCYRILDVLSVSESGEIDFDMISMISRDLGKCIDGCDRAIFLAATVGHEIDRLIRRYESVSPAKALFMQAIGAERVETMLDYFCTELTTLLSERLGIDNIETSPRYSPGYGDLSLLVQPDFIKIVDASRKIGITVGDSLLMAPSKSVTAIIGIRNKS